MTDKKPLATIYEIEVEGSFMSNFDKGKKLDAPVEHKWFCEEKALAAMLADETCFLNSFWMEEDWPKEAKDSINVLVNCNDVFAWGCADAERLPSDDIETLYRMWLKDRAWGPAVWCMIKRNQMPQKPVEDRIRKEGIWNLEKLNLGPNYQEAEVKAYLAQVCAQIGR